MTDMSINDFFIRNSHIPKLKLKEFNNLDGISSYRVK